MIRNATTLAARLNTLADRLSENPNLPFRPSPDRLRRLAEDCAERTQPDPREESLRLFLSRHSKLQGVAILRHLLAHPGEDLPADRLDLLAQPSVAAPDTLADLPSLLLEQPILLCDNQTLRQLRARRHTLTNSLAQTDLSPERRAREESELQGLDLYLREALAPGGNIRNFSTSSHKAVKRARSSLRRLLQLAREEDPNLHSWLERHLTVGKSCRWDVDDMVSGEW